MADQSTNSRYKFVRGQGDNKQASELDQLKGYKAILIACDPNVSATVGPVIVLMERET